MGAQASPTTGWRPSGGAQLRPSITTRRAAFATEGETPLDLSNVKAVSTAVRPMLGSDVRPSFKRRSLVRVQARCAQAFRTA